MRKQHLAVPTRQRGCRNSCHIVTRPGTAAIESQDMNARPLIAVSMLALCLLVFSINAQQRSFYQQSQYKGQEIGKLTGDVYYARMDDYVSAFMVTPEGIVLVEPIGTE